METQLPTDSHDFALWLFSRLEGLSTPNNGILWEGRLPDAHDFELVASHLENETVRLSGNCRADTRTIEFYPSYVDVYEDLDQLLSLSRNRTRIPDRFALRRTNFHYPSSDDCNVATESVWCYLKAVRLFSILRDLADVRNGEILFVQSHDAQLAIMPDFESKDLRELPSFDTFVAEFSPHGSHSEQKRAIIRMVLIEHFRPSRRVTLAEVLAKFEEIATAARHSLAMYMAEFSVAKIKNEVERQNLEDTLSLNKTISDIQNQLLALPAAVLLAGATIKAGEPVRNYAVLVGVLVFTVFVLILASNQRHSVAAIESQMERRVRKIKKMPSDSSAEILPLFSPIGARVAQQKRTIMFIKWTVLLIAAVVTTSVALFNHPGLPDDLLRFVNDTFEDFDFRE